MLERLYAKAKIQISRRVDVVLNAIVNPETMKNFFISWGSGEMTEGASVQWMFPEFSEKFEVKVMTVKPGDIRFTWGEGPEETTVEIKIEYAGKDSSIVTVIESAKDNNEAGITWMRGNTEGWANFLACLKAWLEHNINLRKGAFDFMRKNEVGD